MAVDLVTLNLALDVVWKILLLAVLAYVVVILRNIDSVVSSAQKSARTVENTTENIAKIMSYARYLPMVGGGRKGEKDDE